jgi:hypothetical protein
MGTLSRYRYPFLVTVALLVLLVLLQACGRNEPPATATPRAGGVEMTEPSSVDVTAAEAEPSAPVVPTPTPVVYSVGAVITATVPVTLYATAASSSTVLEIYGSGVAFTVLEPNDQFTAYPVSNGGASWVRVRAGDGLAGWAKADALPN